MLVRPRRTSGATKLGELGLLGQIEAARLGTCKARARQRPRGLAADPLGRRGRGRGGRLGLLGAPDVFLALACEQGLELFLLDGLALDEDLGDGPEGLAVLGEDVLG